MKIRVGFVSNSSTSSFLIYGVCLDDNDIKIPEDQDSYDFYDELQEKAKKHGLKMHSPGDYGGWYIGMSWDCVKDDETGLQFKQRTEKAIEELLGKKCECGTQSAAWYNG